MLDSLSRVPCDVRLESGVSSDVDVNLGLPGCEDSAAVCLLEVTPIALVPDVVDHF